MNSKKTKSIIIVSSAIILMIIFILVYVIVFRKNNDSPQQSAMVEVTTETTVTTAPPETEPPVTTTEAPLVAEYNSGLYLKAQEYHKQNSDVVGWIRISNTNVDYPILQNGDNDFYINHDFYGNPSIGGYIFLDYRNYFGDLEANHSDNLLIYGHNMGNGTMFNTLHRYKNRDFYLQNPYVEISSLYRDYQYKIYTCMLVNGSAATDFDFWNYLVFPMDESKTAEEEFNIFKSQVDAHSIFTTGVDIQLGDKFISLSTCNSGSTSDHTRFVTVARRVRYGEDPAAGVNECTMK